MLKNLIGLGILTLPYATAQVGWLPSVVGMVIVAVLSLCGILLAVAALARLQERREAESPERDALADVGEPEESYPDDALGLSFFHLLVGEVIGGQAQLVCALSFVVGQYATGVAYVDIVATNLVIVVAGGDDSARLGVLLALGALLALLSLTDSLRRVAYLSAIGLLIYVWIFVALICENIEFGTADTVVAVRSSSPNYGCWFGLTSFSFAGLPIAMLIHDDMEDREQFQSVMTGSYAITWVLYSSVAMLGYLCYGTSSEGVIYLSFKEYVFYQGSVLAVAVILIFSFVLQMMPLFDCAQKACARFPALAEIPRWALVIAVVGSTIFVAYCIPDCISVLDNVGSFAGVLVNFIFPALVYAWLTDPDETAARALCVLLVVFGTVGGISATFA